MEAEYASLTDAAHSDYTTVIDFSNSCIQNSKTKHIFVKYHFFDKLNLHEVV